jgi:hypothetical protein
MPKPIETLLTLALLVAGSLSAHADDGFVVSEGDTLHPTNSTTIQMSREDLHISYDAGQDSWRVQVHFVFHNPSASAFSHLVAFENLALAGTAYDNQIRDFVATVDGNPVEVSRTEQQIPPVQEGPPRSQVKELFTFAVQFPPGDTIVDHSYRYFGSMGSGPDRRGFYYTLETAKRWSGPIREFHLDIAMPLNSILLPDTVWQWLQPYGDFVLKPKYVLFGRYPEKNGVFLANGGLRYDGTDFVPSGNLWIESYDLPWYLGSEPVVTGKPLTTRDVLFTRLVPNDLKGYSPRDLRLLRNAIFAWHGYRFADPALGEYFNSFVWYGGVTWDPSTMTKVQRDNVVLIQNLE